MNRKRRLGLFLFSLVLWIQLVFGVGLAAWRFWSVGRGQSEIFVGRGPAVRTEDLIEVIQKHCSDDLRLLYAGENEAQRFYVKYELFPKTMRVLKINWQADPVEREILDKAEEALATGEDACLILDDLRWQTTTGNSHLIVNDHQSVIFILGSE